MRPLLLLFLLLLAPLGARAAGLSVVGDLTREAALAPGEHVEGEIQVRNTTDEPMEVRVHLQDYRFHADGRSEFLPPGTLQRSNTGWIRFSPEQAVLEPGTTTVVSWTMAIPEDATPTAGTFWSTLMIEPVPDEIDPEEGEVGVRTVFRYAIQMVTQVGASRDPLEIAFAAPKLEGRDGTAHLAIDVTNGGERWLNPTVWAELYAADGEAMGRFEAGQKRLFPDCSARFGMDLTGVPPGEYTALVVADGGGEDVYGAQYNLDLTALQPSETASARGLTER